MSIKEDSKGSSKWPNKGKIRCPNQSTKRAQNATERAQMDRTGQSPPRADRGAHHGPWWDAHGRACLRCLEFCGFRVPIRIPAVFSAALP